MRKCTVLCSKLLCEVAMLRQFSIFHGTLFFSTVGLDQVQGVISMPDISLNFDVVMHSTMTYVIVWNGLGGPNLRFARSCEIFPCQAWTKSERRYYCCDSKMISDISVKFAEVMHSTTKQFTTKNSFACPICAHYIELWNFPWLDRTRSDGRWE